MRERPDPIDGITYRIPSPVGTVFVTINSDDDGPFEVFVNVGKSGSNTTAFAEAVGRLISMILRMEDGLSIEDRAIEIVGQLKDIGSTNVAGIGSDKTYSCPDAVAQAMAKNLGIWENNGEGSNTVF